MVRYQVPYKAEHIPSLPAKCRPILRYRREEFGFLAAFPNGRVGMYEPSVEPLLLAGSSYEECKPHLVTRLSVPTEFHFSAPLMAWVELTRACNLRCPHCFVEAGAPREVEMSTDRILRLLDEWAEMGVFSVVITGGEPSIHPDFLRIVHYAYDLGFTVAIASNGMPLTHKTLEQIPQDDVIISVSLDGIHGAGAATGESDYDAVTRKLLQIRDFGFNTSIMTTTTHENVGDLQNFINFAIDNDISLRSVPFVPMGRGKLYRELQNQVGDIEKAAQFWLAEEKWERVKDKELGLCAGKVFNFLITMVYTLRRCMSGRGLCYVTSDGTVYPCSNCSGSKILNGGSLLERSFADIWNDDDWPIRGITWKTFLEKTCQGCQINSEEFFCTGRCPSSSYALNGVVDGCGVSEFQRHSILRREELFREVIHEEPRIYNSQVKTEALGQEADPSHLNQIASQEKLVPLGGAKA
ncbi:MAG TPA: radical SAM protein [Thermoanaerobaculia bacterium]